MNLGLSANIQRMVVADSVENPRQLLVTKVQIVGLKSLFLKSAPILLRIYNLLVTHNTAEMADDSRPRAIICFHQKMYNYLWLTQQLYHRV